MVTHNMHNGRMKENRSFSGRNIRFVKALDLIKCLKRITEIAPYVRTFF